MRTSDILSIISISFSVLFALPPFIKMIIDFFHNTIKFKIVGINYDDKNKCYILSIQLINFCNKSISIINMSVNGQSVILKEKDKLIGPLEKTINANDNKIFTVMCPFLKENEMITIKIRTTKRRVRYKKQFKSIIQMLNNKGKE